MVEEKQISIGRGRGSCNFFKLSTANKRGRIRAVAVLQDLTNNFSPRANCEVAKLGKRLFCSELWLGGGTRLRRCIARGLSCAWERLASISGSYERFVSACDNPSPPETRALCAFRAATQISATNWLHDYAIANNLSPQCPCPKLVEPPPVQGRPGSSLPLACLRNRARSWLPQRLKLRV